MMRRPKRIYTAERVESGYSDRRSVLRLTSMTSTVGVSSLMSNVAGLLFGSLSIGNATATWRIGQF